MAEFVAKNGEKLSVKYDGGKITVQNVNGEIVGWFEFREIEVPNGYSSDFHLHLCHMDLDKYKGQGLGRFCLQVVRNESGMEIIASDPNDHEKKDDGSHLIGDGPGFVKRMQREGIIAGGERLDNEE